MLKNPDPVPACAPDPGPQTPDPRPLYPAVGAPVLQRVLLVDQYTRAQPGYRFISSSLPGHLIQCVVQGHTLHEVNGRQYELQPGSLIWYHEDEQVRGHVTEGPWVFYTINFIAPALSPPPFEARVRVVSPELVQRCADLLAAWRDTAAPPAVREMRVQARLLALLAELASGAGEPFRTDPTAQLWWELETHLRQDLSRPISLPMMAQLSGRSVATIARSCAHAVGLPPMRRIKQVRMSLARGLVLRSELRISEIAARVGYQRVHEFSRDYHKHFGLPPTEQRRRRGG